MNRLLKAQGYPIMLAFDGSDVPTLVTEGNPRLVNVNWYLQNPSGLEVLQQLRAQGYAAKIIVLAGYSASTEIPRALFFSIDQVLGQPVSFNQIVSAVRVGIGSLVTDKDQPCRSNESFVPLATMA